MLLFCFQFLLVCCMNSATNRANSLSLYEPFVTASVARLLSSKTLNIYQSPTPISLSDRTITNTYVKPVPSTTSISLATYVSSSDSNKIRARFAHLSTSPHSCDGVNVLNFVIYPNPTFDMPVFGADFVTLPGGKNLVLLDFQPLTASQRTNSGDYEIFAKASKIRATYLSHFPWGGDLPPEASKFFSDKALIWTRCPGEEGRELIQTKVFDVFQEYLELYVSELEKRLDTSTNALLNKDYEAGVNEYNSYRRANDPARPMLKRLFGDEFTESAIEHLF